MVVISFDVYCYLRQLHSGKKPAIRMILSMKVSVNFSKVLLMMLARSYRSDFPCRDTSRPNMAALRYHFYSVVFSFFTFFLNLTVREKLSLEGNFTCCTKSLVVRTVWQCIFKRSTISSRTCVFLSILIVPCRNGYFYFVGGFSALKNYCRLMIRFWHKMQCFFVVITKG